MWHYWAKLLADCSCVNTQIQTHTCRGTYVCMDGCTCACVRVPAYACVFEKICALVGFELMTSISLEQTSDHLNYWRS